MELPLCGFSGERREAPSDASPENFLPLIVDGELHELPLVVFSGELRGAPSDASLGGFPLIVDGELREAPSGGFSGEFHERRLSNRSCKERSCPPMLL